MLQYFHLMYKNGETIKLRSSHKSQSLVSFSRNEKNIKRNKERGSHYFLAPMKKKNGGWVLKQKLWWRRSKRILSSKGEEDDRVGGGGSKNGSKMKELWIHPPLLTLKKQKLTQTCAMLPHVSPHGLVAWLPGSTVKPIVWPNMWPHAG